MESTQPPQVTQTTTTTYTTPSKRSPILLVLLSLLSLLLLLSTAFLGYQNMQLTKQVADLTKPLPTPTPQSITKPIYQINAAPWKEVTNYTKSSLSAENLDRLISSSNRSIKTTDDLYPDPFIAIYVKKIDSSTDFSNWVTKFSSFMDAKTSNIQKFNTNTTLVQGTIGLGLTTGEWNVRYYLFTSPDQQYEFAILTADATTQSHQTAFDQILSTFKFMK